MKKKSVYLLILTLVLLLGTEIANAQFKKWALVMTKGTGYTNQAWRTRYDFPEKEIKELWDDGYEITNLSYGMKLWCVVGTKGTTYTAQRWKTLTDFPKDDIKKAWDDGYYITDLVYGNGKWAAIFSKGSKITQQAWRTRTNFPETEINELTGEGYAITNLCYGEDRWALVMSKGTGMDKQVWFESKGYPDEKIKQYWDDDYYITDITYGNGEWVVVMSKGTGFTKQSWRTRTYYPEKEIKELWDDSHYITTIVSDFDTAPIDLSSSNVVTSNISNNLSRRRGSSSLNPMYLKTNDDFSLLNINYTGTENSCISRDAYLEDPSTGTHYNLIGAVGIPICETDYYKKIENFSLIFDKVPSSVKVLNLVEIGASNSFNLYGMKIDGSVVSPMPTTDNNLAKTEPTGLPPILSIEDIALSTNSISATETSTLSVTLKNVGPGDARDVTLNLESNLKDLQFASSTEFPVISANGGKQTISVPITGTVDLPATIAQLKIEVQEPHFKVKIQGKQLSVPTQEFQKPELLLAKYAMVENQSANPNNQIDINEMVDLVFAVQNVGLGDANNVNISVDNNQKGVMFLGVVNGNQLLRQNPTFGSIPSGKYETVTYRYFINSEFTDPDLQFTINANEKVGKFGFSQPKEFAINTKLSEEGYIRTVASNNVQSPANKVVIEDIPDFVVDVDTNIPTASTSNNSAYALIVGNEDYSSRQVGLSKEQNVEFAVNDANMFALYCEKTIGIPKRQIKVLLNATAAEISQGLAWLANLAKIENGNAELYFYYSGHGLPDEQTKEAYLVPVDVSGSNLTYAIKVADVYKTLSEQPTKRVNVFLDACFSGGGRNEGLVAVKGVKVKPKNAPIPNKMVVLTSSTGDESSAVYKEKQHGYFTYFLLKKLQETKGDVNYNDLSSYIIQNVRKETGISGKIQTPQVLVNPDSGENWKGWTLK